MKVTNAVHSELMAARRERRQRARNLAEQQKAAAILEEIYMRNTIVFSEAVDRGTLERFNMMVFAAADRLGIKVKCVDHKPLEHPEKAPHTHDFVEYTAQEDHVICKYCGFVVTRDAAKILY